MRIARGSFKLTTLERSQSKVATWLMDTAGMEQCNKGMCKHEVWRYIIRMRKWMFSKLVDVIFMAHYKTLIVQINNFTEIWQIFINAAKVTAIWKSMKSDIVFPFVQCTVVLNHYANLRYVGIFFRLVEPKPGPSVSSFTTHKTSGPQRVTSKYLLNYGLDCKLWFRVFHKLYIIV